ncbi:MAG: TIM barrel protein [Gaiellaceae bacterium]
MPPRIRVGPARLPSRESPEQAIELVLERGYSACEIDFESGFWMDYPFAERLGELAHEHDVALSVHAPLFGFMGHLEASGRKFASAVGALDRSAGIAATSGAAPVVFHPGFLLGRDREDAIDAVVEQVGMLRERLEGKGRAVPFGVEVMGRVRDLGSVDDVVEISRRTSWVRPVLDFAHMHATSDGAFLDVEPFAEALELVDSVLAPDVPFHIHKSDSTSPHPEAASEDPVPFHIHVSDIAFANRNEKHHLPYGEGTLRVGPLRDALAQFGRPATIISESPDEESTQIIKDVLLGLREDIPGPAARVS